MSETGRIRRDWNSRCDVPLLIGLVNNASDSGLRATEVQFLRMLQAASTGFDLRFKLFNSPEIPRSAPAVDGSGKPYADIEDLFDAPLDGLIVTGMEPMGKTLPDEPVWNNITRLVDWARENSVPVIWSCLAAHAAVLYLDGLARTLLPEKLSGIFVCNLIATDHRLACGLPERWVSPHSRKNDLSQSALLANGYQILSCSEEAGVDVFLKEGFAPFLFFQGHPEYDSDTILRQYWRDVRRFIGNRSNEFPSVPKNHFDPTTEAALTAAGDRARQNNCGLQDLEAISSLMPTAVSSNLWEQTAASLCANWLTLVARWDARSRRRKFASTKLSWNSHVTGGTSVIP